MQRSRINQESLPGDNGVYRECYSALSWLRRHRLDLECFRRLITAAAAALNRTGAVKKEETRSFPFMDGYLVIVRPQSLHLKKYFVCVIAFGAPWSTL